jgi:hypothetical protein
MKWLTGLLRLPKRVIRRLIPRFVRVAIARTVQHAGLCRERAASSRKLILFLVPGQEIICGGVLSIFSLYRLSRSLEDVHKSHVLMCFLPGEAGYTLRYRKFKNDVLIYPLEMVLRTCRDASEVLLHVPEYAVPLVMSRLGKEGLADLRQRCGLKINILNQNVLMMPDLAVVQSLKEIIPDLTCTTAHPRYSTPEQRRYWGVPMHHLPAWYHPGEVVPRPFETKQDLMIVSADRNPHREAVLDTLAKSLPHLEMRIISGIPFEEYLRLERAAKWSVTFGEGMDTYFQGVFFRGGVGFAVYNDKFFTPEYRGLRTVYPSYDAMQERIVEDIKSLDNKSAMESYSAQVRSLLAGGWGPDRTRSALEAFYRGQLTYP